MRTKSKPFARPLILLLALPAIFSQAPAMQVETATFLVRNDLTGTRGGNLVASISEDPETFNRLFATRVPNAAVTGLLSADLVHINRSSFGLEPSLAASWQVAKDNRTYTIHLRRGLRF